MANFWKILGDVIANSDIILEVLDSRMPELTRNNEIEDKAGDKPIIYVLNKCDLIPQKRSEEIKKRFGNKAIFVSCKEYHGIKILKERIYELSRKPKVVVGVVGYPNTGKSSIINALTSRSAAKTSAHSGYTKGKQLIRLKKGVYLMDTPGVIPYKEDDSVKHGMIAAINPSETKDPDLVAMEIIKLFKGDYSELERAYKISINEDDDEYDIFLLIGKSINYLAKGGAVDEKRAGIRIIQDWQRGKINSFKYDD